MDQEAISWSTNYGNNWLPRNQGIIADSIFTICINPQDKSKMWAGGPLAIYKSLRQGDWWNECTKGMRIEPGRALTAKFPNVIYSLTGGSVHRSFNFGKDWTTLYKAVWFAAYDIAVNPQFPANVFIAVEGGAQVNHIYKTENYGKDWWVCYSPPFNPTRIKLSIDPVKPDTVYAVFRYGGPEPLARSTNNGYSWELLSVASPEPSLYAVINDPIYSDTLYVAGEDGKVYYSTNAGINWVERSNGIPNSTVEVLGIDPVNTAIIYAGTLNNGVYKTTNYGVQWLPKNIGLGSDPPEVLPEIWSLVIDPEEPTILYIGVRYPTTFEGRAYISVDGAAKWFEISNNLEQMSPYDLIIDPMYADTTFANTDKGVYIYKPEFNKSLVSNSSEATFANNGRKLLRVYGTNELWACYESGGVIYAVHSTDDGQTWSRKQEIGEGYTPALAIRDVPDYPPYIVWRADGEIRDTIYFAGYISGNKWSDPFPLVVSQPDIDFGPPSFVIGDYNIGHLAYSDGSNSYYTSFSVYNPGNSSTEVIGSGINPCIGFMPTQEYPQVHCVLEDDGVIYYSARGENGWTEYYEVSRDEGNNITITDCHHPSLVVVEGDVVYVVWDGVLDGNRNIFWRHLTYFGEESSWSWIWPVCNTTSPSSYPVLTTGFFCSWVERQGNDYEIYYARYEPPVWGWRGQTNLSNSPDKISVFSHLAHKQTDQGTDIYFIWTENSVPPYDIKFERVTIGGGGGSGPDALAGLPLYIAKGGEEEKSPFNTRRGGGIFSMVICHIKELILIVNILDIDLRI
ncbi:MAG: hypothetical protein ABIL07_02830 [candidate division WOR-3 bacterium]